MFYLFNNMDTLPNDNNIMINDRYIIKDKIGSGSFGTIYTATDVFYKNKVALKMESINISTPQLLFERKIYKILTNTKGIPKIYNYFPNYKLPWGIYNILVMQCLDASLENLFARCQRKFSLKTTLQIGIQMINRIAHLHNKSLIHRDIKPDNFLIDSSNTVYLADFGLSKLYRDLKTNIHIPYREDKRLIGTPRYASINMHLGIEASRRDDLESIGYVLVYFLIGSLPWQGIKAMNRRNKYRKITDKKLATPIELLCKNLPHQFIDYFQYVRLLRFADRPDYSYLSKLFKNIAVENNIILDEKYDWDELKESVIKNDLDKDIHNFSNKVEHYDENNQDNPLSLQQTKNQNSKISQNNEIMEI
jgi:casein kinase 1